MIKVGASGLLEIKRGQDARTTNLNIWDAFRFIFWLVRTWGHRKRTMGFFVCVACAVWFWRLCICFEVRTVPESVAIAGF